MSSAWAFGCHRSRFWDLKFCLLHFEVEMLPTACDHLVFVRRVHIKEFFEAMKHLAV